MGMNGLQPAAEREIKAVLCGGGNDIFRILKDISAVFKGKTVGYVAVAAETNPALLLMIRSGFSNLIAHFKSLGAVGAMLVESGNFADAFENDVIIISGGDSQYLLRVLGEKGFSSKLAVSNVQTVVGISAGAIALSHQGVGSVDTQEKVFDGMNFIDVMVVPHSNGEKRRRYPEATHLTEYQWREFSFSSPRR